MSQQPTFQITKKHFVGVINSLHAQFVKDKENTSLLGQIYNAEITGYYDNSNLVNAVFSFLHEVFPKDEDGFCPIEHYCYTLSFGKCGEEYETPEQLYDRLILGKGIMWVSTPDGLMWVSSDEVNLPPKSVVGPASFGAPMRGVGYSDEAGQWHKDADFRINPLTVGDMTALNDWAQCETRKTAPDMSDPANEGKFVIIPEKYRGPFSTGIRYVKTSPDETA